MPARSVQKRAVRSHFVPQSAETAALDAPSAVGVGTCSARSSSSVGNASNPASGGAWKRCSSCCRLPSAKACIASKHSAKPLISASNGVVGHIALAGPGIVCSRALYVILAGSPSINRRHLETFNENSLGRSQCITLSTTYRNKNRGKGLVLPHGLLGLVQTCGSLYVRTCRSART